MGSEMNDSKVTRDRREDLQCPKQEKTKKKKKKEKEGRKKKQRINAKVRKELQT